MSCFTLLKFLDVCKWILVSILFFGDWHMLCQKLKSCTPNICSQKRQVYCFYHVHFSCCLFGFALFCSLSLFSCSLLFISHLLFGFPKKIVCINMFLQQSICITFISHVVGFALSCCLLLPSCSLLVHFPHCCLSFWFFCFYKHFLQQSICFFNMVTRM
jgi:hypothetical protein